MKLFSHINGDSDLIEAWLQHYLALGVDAFHVVLHGPRKENETLRRLRDAYPVLILDEYEGPMLESEKIHRLQTQVQKHAGEWVVVADSDEFLELPEKDLAETCALLEAWELRNLSAPLLQKIRPDGLLESPSRIGDPGGLFSQAAPRLCEHLGARPDLRKYPVFFVQETSRLHGGNHLPPNPGDPPHPPVRGVSHHYKWRQSLLDRLRSPAGRFWFCAQHEYPRYQAYLAAHGHTLPLQDTFACSRQELFRRGLLRNPKPSPQARLPKAPRERPSVTHLLGMDAASDPLSAPLILLETLSLAAQQQKEGWDTEVLVLHPKDHGVRPPYLEMLETSGISYHVLQAPREGPADPGASPHYTRHLHRIFSERAGRILHHHLSPFSGHAQVAAAESGCHRTVATLYGVPDARRERLWAAELDCLIRLNHCFTLPDAPTAWWLQEKFRVPPYCLGIDPPPSLSSVPCWNTPKAAVLLDGKAMETGARTGLEGPDFLVFATAPLSEHFSRSPAPAPSAGHDLCLLLKGAGQAWNRLLIADALEGAGLWKRHLEARGIPCLTPDDLPAGLGKQPLGAQIAHLNSLPLAAARPAADAGRKEGAWRGIYAALPAESGGENAAKACRAVADWYKIHLGRLHSKNKILATFLEKTKQRLHGAGQQAPPPAVRTP
jgi:hypothetical protein